MTTPPTAATTCATPSPTVPGFQGSLAPSVYWSPVAEQVANELLVQWGHRMGPHCRPFPAIDCHALVADGRPVAVAVTSCLIRENVAGLPHLTRKNTVELARLCAERSGLCRVAIRLWREFVFPKLGRTAAVSYQDADLHRGHTYRFDGWARSPAVSRSGRDGRSGRKGRRKRVWVWPPERLGAGGDT